MAVALALFLITCSQTWAAGSDNQIVREDNGQIATALNLPIYTWQQVGQAPRAVIVTIHGTTLHGAVFDTLASNLAKEGYLVVSPDLRGFGRWYLGKGQFAPQGSVSYTKSKVDLLKVLAALRKEYANLPIFCVGESLGANVSLWLASTSPNYLDGAIISNPCVKRRFDLCSTMIIDTVKTLLSHKRQIPLAPYARRFLSEDPRIVQAYLADPLIRKSLNVIETFQGLNANKSALLYIDQIPADLPVLVIAGSKDRMFNSKKIKPLLARTKIRDQQICWLPGKGHIQLETPYINETVASTMSTWLSVKTTKFEQSRKVNRLLSRGDSCPDLQ